MSKNQAEQPSLFDGAPFAFADRFLQDHAGQIISEPRTAILELIANSYDAGATQIDIVWPTERGETISVTDNGMTKAEFEKRWKTFCYDRVADQGTEVVFPKDVRGIKRTAFGRSGKGRYAPFCFADSYEIVTTKDGDTFQVRVGLAVAGITPFEIKLLGEAKKQGHGTEISAVLEKHLLGVEDLRQLIGSKFIVDPSLCINVNQKPVQLMSLEGLKTTKILVDHHGTITVHFIDSFEHHRSSKLRGITWWVNQRRVGEPSWDRLDDEGAYLDGRTEHAKKFSFIVMADFLTPGQDVKADWSDFHANQRTNAVREAVHRYVIKEIQAQLATTRKERKRNAIENSRKLIGELPTISKKAIGQFIDEVQEKCPTISDRDLSRTVQVLAKLEKSRSGYDLLTQLAVCSPYDLDTWNSLMQQWKASNAEIVLNELDRRLKLIERMEKLVENPLADELHDLQPLFERGLWIFGPEYEAVDFRSNRGLAEVIGKFLGGADYKPPKRRPDFVVLPETSIGTYCADAYDTAGEIAGIRKVAILELKKGGFCVTQKEADQARNYSKEIRKGGRVSATTEVVAYVLGATLEEGLEPADYGENKNTHIIPMVYQTVLRKAHQRTFNLQKLLQETQPAIVADPEVDEVLQVDGQMPLFDEVPQPHIQPSNGSATPSAPTTQSDGAHMTTTTTSPPPEQGQMVSVRSRNWMVTDVSASTLPPERLQTGLESPQHLITLSSVEDDGLGEELNVIWELEPGARVVEKVALPDPTGFDPPDRLDAFLDAVRWGASSSADLRNIQAPFRSGIDIEDYQLDPVVRAIQMPRVNLLIADDVGLGKTIEAGMVTLELIIRHRTRKILIVCPASLQVQWQEQMRDKFGLDFRIVNSTMMGLLRRSRGIHVNPWNHFPRLITSIDFLKRERPLRLFRELLPGPDEPAFPRKFDMMIVDEAHNCAPSGRGRYATDSMRTQALRLLVPHFEHKLFLTATPHNGYPESFSALLELLDNQRFARSTTPDRKQLNAVMVRRMKSELPPKWDGSPRFPRRVLDPIEVPYTDEERTIHAALQSYARLRAQRSQDNAEKLATEFVLKTLKKRLFSSPAAFLTTLDSHEKSLRQAKRGKAIRKPSIGVLKQELDRIDEDYADDNEYDEATSDAMDAASLLFSEPSENEIALLKQMRQWAEKASGQLDSKVKCLIDWLNTHIRPGKKWGHERVILFTEYRATQNWLKEVLAQHGFTKDDRLLTMFGGMDLEEREDVKAAFQSAPEVSQVRILLATDAAAEGLNLQNHCYRLIHYEIPWNPNRLEQRNGRIDRHGQKGFLAPNGERQVFVYHFVGQGYRERQKSAFSGRASDLDADLEFLMRVAQKVETIREDLGSYGTVLADDVEQAMLGRGYSMPGVSHADTKVEPVRKMLKFERDLAKQINELLAQYQETQRELRLSPENVRKVVEVGLALAEQPSLVPIEHPSNRPVFTLPALKHSWAACAEGLEHPHTKDIRPITFDHTAADGRDDVVLVHLNHRLVQMSLRLLRAEVWSVKGRKRLHRITARLVPDQVLNTPAVVAHARLVVIGGDSHRLHEEIITAGGMLKEGRFSRLNIGEVDKLLAAATDDEAFEPMQKHLLELWDKFAPALAQSLEARMKDRTNGLQKKLGERAEKEADDIKLILLELKKAIDTELADPEYQQMTLFDDPEKEQFERNRDFLRDRSKAIPAEIERETAAIKSRYADPQPRMFPVAVTFLVPERMAKG